MITAWFPVWAVLGVSRLHHLLATGTMTSKCGAGRYAQKAFGPRWQPIIAESLYLRTSGAEGRRSYRSPLARRRDTLAFLDTRIEAALRLDHAATIPGTDVTPAGPPRPGPATITTPSHPGGRVCQPGSPRSLGQFNRTEQDGHRYAGGSQSGAGVR